MITGAEIDNCYQLRLLGTIQIALPIPFDFPLAKGVIDIPGDIGRDTGMFNGKEFIIFGPELPPEEFDEEGVRLAEDFIFMGGGTKTVLTWTGLVVAEGPFTVDDVCGMKAAICLGGLCIED